MPAVERASIIAELTPPFQLLRPQTQLTPTVFCSPHSGRIYPKAFLEASRLDPHTLRKSEDCYVDERLQVHGLAGLRVADASIFPTMPSGNTNAPAIMVGEKAADLIRGAA